MKQLLMSSENDIQICHVNIWGFENNFNTIVLFYKTYTIDIF